MLLGLLIATGTIGGAPAASGVVLRSDGRRLRKSSLTISDRAVYLQANGRLAAATNFPANRVDLVAGRLKRSP
jgi:hypothetical protein